MLLFFHTLKDGDLENCIQATFLFYVHVLVGFDHNSSDIIHLSIQEVGYI